MISGQKSRLTRRVNWSCGLTRKREGGVYEAKQTMDWTLGGVETTE